MKKFIMILLISGCATNRTIPEEFSAGIGDIKMRFICRDSGRHFDMPIDCDSNMSYRESKGRYEIFTENEDEYIRTNLCADELFEIESDEIQVELLTRVYGEMVIVEDDRGGIMMVCSE